MKFLLIRLLALVALALSAAMFVDSLRSNPAFCSVSAGCSQVTQSAFGRVLGVPLSFWGVLGFAALVGTTLLPGKLPMVFVGPVACAAGFAGFVLIGLQVFYLKSICPMCMVVDSCALLAAAVELGISNPAQPAPLPSRKWPWVLAMCLSIAGPFAWSALRPSPPVPSQIRALWKPGMVNVVEITDFECPNCRDFHPILESVRASEEVHFVRLCLPLEKHKNSRTAALAWQCADSLGRGEEMAASLFAADDLSRESVIELAESLNLDRAAVESCLDDPDRNDAFDAQLDWLDKAAEEGLPTIWVQEELYVGQHTAETLKTGIRRARERLSAKSE